MKFVRKQTNSEPSSSKPTRKLRREVLVAIIGVLLVMNLIWFVAWLIPSSPEGKEEVASVDGKTITREMWLSAMEEKIGRETLKELVDQEVMQAAAKEYKISVSKKELNTEIALLQARGEDAYVELDLDKGRELVQSSLILEKVLTKDIVIDEKELKKHYEDQKDLYHIETAYRLSMIKVQTVEEAEQTIKELKDGSDFSALAKEKSIDIQSASLGGDLGYINQSSEYVDQTIIDAASKLKKGKVSKPIKLSDDTYAVIMLNDKIKGKKFKFKEVKDHIHRQLAMEQLPDKVTPDAFWKDFDVEWFYES